MTDWRIENAGADALLIRFGETVAPQLLARIDAAAEHLQSTFGGRLLDLVPSYTTLLVYYNPLEFDFDNLAAQINQELAGLGRARREPTRLVEIPVWYAPEVGPDLLRVAELHQISVDEVIARHSAQLYQVYAIGFAPGFAYLGEVAQSLATPRLPTPRQNVPAGSVALADRQTAVYPLATPGGWNLLGRTTMAMFNPALPQLCPLSVGDQVQFVPISRAQFLDAGGAL